MFLRIDATVYCRLNIQSGIFSYKLELRTEDNETAFSAAFLKMSFTGQVTFLLKFCCSSLIVPPLFVGCLSVVSRVIPIISIVSEEKAKNNLWTNWSFTVQVQLSNFQLFCHCNPTLYSFMFWCPSCNPWELMSCLADPNQTNSLQWIDPGSWNIWRRKEDLNKRICT